MSFSSNLMFRATRGQAHRPLAFALTGALILAVASSPALAAQDAAAPASGQRFAPEVVLSALAAAYPGRFSAPQELEGEWRIDLDGESFSWAEGRLLPAAALGAAAVGATAAGSAATAANRDRQPFYAYPSELPALRTLTPDERLRFQALAAGRDRQPPLRDPSLFDRIWGASDEDSAWARMKATRFLGKSLLFHRDLLEELAAVEAEILERAQSDRGLAAWVEGLGSAGGYIWRDIAGTRSRSYHAYGAAIDLLPAKTGGRAWYWLDARKSGLAWYELPYEKRLSVPAAVVEAFERRGFVWGGKWLYWDLVHFEYRPEILILSGQSPELQPRIR